MTGLLSIPATLLAVNGLISAVPFSRRRWHEYRLEKLSKIVGIGGDDCPRVLRVKLAQELHTVAAYHAIGLTTRERMVLWVGWVGAIVVFLVFIGLERIFRWYRATSPILYNSPTIAFSVVVALQIFPVAIIMDSLDARRLLYARFGSRSDLPSIPGPRWWKPSPTSSVVKGWVKDILGEPNPDPKRVDALDVQALRRAIAEWESDRRQFLSRMRIIRRTR